MNGGPALGGGFAGHFVVAGSMQDGDAELSVGVDVGVVEGAYELEICSASVAGLRWASVELVYLVA